VSSPPSVAGVALLWRSSLALAPGRCVTSLSAAIAICRPAATHLSLARAWRLRNALQPAIEDAEPRDTEASLADSRTTVSRRAGLRRWAPEPRAPTVRNVHNVVGAFPDVEGVRGRCRALANPKAILEPECDLRCFSLNSRWAPAKRRNM
jgi:hypothetical protein